MRSVAIVVVLVIVAAGCGSETKEVTPRQPHLPRALAESWAKQSEAVAAALAANDGCGAQSRATALQQSVIAAVNDHRVPRRFLEPLTSGVNDLAARITCTPPPEPAPAPSSHGHSKMSHGHSGKPPKEHHEKDRGD